MAVRGRSVRTLAYLLILRRGHGPMWRAFFMAIGLSLCILGIECLVFEKAVLNKRRQEPPPSFVPAVPYLQTTGVEPSYPEIKFADWAPWTLMCVGSVVICYSLTVAKT